jgi:futalosine hydrolase
MQRSPLLILIPTELERSQLSSGFRDFTKSNGIEIELCGFGAVAAAAKTMDAIYRLKPQLICLLGIAGTYSDTLCVGQAARFGTVTVCGLGVGSGDQHQPASQLGWLQCVSPSIGDSIEFDTDARNISLLSVLAASSDEADAQWKQQIAPHAIAEDMEGFGVAMACRITDTPLRIVRGISNRAGARNHRDWKITDAMLAAEKLVHSILS